MQPILHTKTNRTPPPGPLTGPMSGLSWFEGGAYRDVTDILKADRPAFRLSLPAEMSLGMHGPA